jgi:hypothetical protein
MKLALDDDGSRPLKPPCNIAKCFSRSRTHEDLYWGKRLCPAHEQAWIAYVNSIPLPVGSTEPAFLTWWTLQMAKGENDFVRMWTGTA